MATPLPRHTDPTEHPALSASLRTLARRGVVKTYRKGTQLIEEGDHGDTLYIILAGRLRSYSSNYKGKELTYGVYGPGDYLGEMSLDGGPRSASVITLEPSTCAVVTRHTLELHLREEPAFAFELLAKVIRRARAATLSAKQMALNDVYGRLVALFNELAVAQPDGTRLIEERLTHLDISMRLGCAREMVSRLLKELERGGYILDMPGGRYRLMRVLPARW